VRSTGSTPAAGALSSALKRQFALIAVRIAEGTRRGTADEDVAARRRAGSVVITRGEGRRIVAGQVVGAAEAHRLEGDADEARRAVAIGIGQRDVEPGAHRLAGIHRQDVEVADRELAVAVLRARVHDLDAVVAFGGGRDHAVSFTQATDRHAAGGIRIEVEIDAADRAVVRRDGDEFCAAS
jgi:hypothetical protein